MPSVACMTPMCGKVTNQGHYCTQCRERKTKQTNRIRGEVSDLGFYKEKRWRDTSRYILQKEPLCRTCMAQGNVTEAKHVDHIMPIKQGGKRYDEDNLQPLCIPCHNRKTKKERNI